MELHEYKQVVTKKVCPSCGQEFELSLEDSCCPQDGSLLAPLMSDPLIGQVLTGSLEIISLLGAGASGRVYKARQAQIDRIVAVKILQSKQIQDMDKIRRFEREAMALSRLSSSNIVAIFDYGLLPLPYMVMEYVDGVSLEDHFEKETIEIKDALKICMQVCDALEAAHKHGVVHRDLKPSNIMLVRDAAGTFRVKVLDFGLARWTPDDESNAPTVTITGDVVGTPAYMSPEQCLGKSPDNRSDIYALGCIMYELVTGKRPYEAATIVEYMNKHTLEEPRSFMEVNPLLDLPDIVEDVVLKAMSKDPKNRFQAVTTFRSALEKCLEGVSKGTTGRRRRKHRRKMHKGRIAAMLSLSALITAGIFLNQIYPEFVPNLIWQKTFDDGKLLFNERKFSEAESKFKEAAELATSFGERDRLRRRFNSRQELLKTYMAASRWNDAASLNDQLIDESGIEDRLRYFDHDGISFFLPAKWFMVRGTYDWNDAARFRVAHTLKWSQAYFQTYQDKVSPEELANLEQRIISRICKNYKLLASKKIAFGKTNNTEGLLKDFEIEGDFGISEDGKFYRFIDTGKVNVHRHIYFGKPGLIQKLRVQGDKIDFPHLCRSLDRIIATVSFDDKIPVLVTMRVDITTAKFYASSDPKKAGVLSIVLPGEKPAAGFDLPVDFKSNAKAEP